MLNCKLLYFGSCSSLTWNGCHAGDHMKLLSGCSFIHKQFVFSGLPCASVAATWFIRNPWWKYDTCAQTSHLKLANPRSYLTQMGHWIQQLPFKCSFKLLYWVYFHVTSLFSFSVRRALVTSLLQILGFLMNTEAIPLLSLGCCRPCYGSYGSLLQTLCQTMYTCGRHLYENIYPASVCAVGG